MTCSDRDDTARAEKVPDKSRVLSDSARKNYLSSIKSMYEYLMLVELVDKDPTRGASVRG